MGKIESNQIAWGALLSILVVIAPISASFHTQKAYAATATGVMVPLYTYPTSSTWDSVAKTKTNYPSVPIIAIVNPSNGPGGSKDSNYAAGIQKLQSAGVTVLGYVYTGYGSRSSTTIKADISAWNSWYKVNGIFFDEMSNTGGKETYYKSLSDYAKSLSSAYTVGNPGADTASSYIGTMDNIIIYENSGLPSLSSLGGWHSNYDKKNFSIIPYAVGSLDRTYVSSASSKVGYIYITNDNLPNPWDSVPSYLSDLASAVNTANGATSSSSSPPPSASTTTSYTVTVKSADLAGSGFNGMWTTISKGGIVIKTGYTPLSFSATSGASYQVTVSNYGNYVFDHWNGGSTSATRTISVTTEATLIAYYGTGSKQVNLTVRSAQLSGTVYSGMWTTVSQGSTTVKTGFTSLSYTAQTGSSYQVTVADYANYLFDHWENGSTSRTRTVTPSSDTVITAYYKS